MSLPADDLLTDDAFEAGVARSQSTALLVGGGALGLLLVAGLIWPQAAASSYLVAYLFWTGISLGCLGLTLLHHLVGGQWGLPIRRPLEAGAATIFLMAALFLPVAFGMSRLYPWTNPELAAELGAKGAYYLNATAFLQRAAFYFALWAALAAAANLWSRSQDTAETSAPSRRLHAIAGPSLVALFLTASFAAIDWAMSLEPRWASTIYGAMVIVGDVLATMALMILVTVSFLRSRPIHEVATPSRLADLGNLLLAFTMLWAYMSFSQFLIIWSGNLAEETPWYLRRTAGGWQWVALLLIVVHFFLPFFVLLFRDNKRDPRTLRVVAGLVLVMHMIDLTWLVIPAFTGPSGPAIPWGQLPMILVAMAGVGGAWLAAFLWWLRRAPLVPLRDPNLLIALQHQGGH
ncbi:hypothetical protein OJF2_79050 (plasmid) [Aquisphaera giovannonii]|uniref:Quinol:cytochrome c oxidoreductase quinone-binding subunit 2 n=1 Tax=Aquisphaera giovannonii TaxID=406548 RepID=A0A5B9WHP9_9BACT|nr:hypothetical protein [Aquisphaera giovannonii]QEH39290.1 hypothetical protein OJF2_79050 [Aquisphaera giovannonii]